MVEGEQRAGTPERRDHLVGHEQHVVLVADLPDAREVVVLRDDDAAGALHRLGQEHRDGVGPLTQNRLFELVGRRDALTHARRGLVAIRVG